MFKCVICFLKCSILFTCNYVFYLLVSLPLGYKSHADRSHVCYVYIARVWLRLWPFLSVCLQCISDAKYLELSEISQVKGIVSLMTASEAHKLPVLWANWLHIGGFHYHFRFDSSLE